MINCILKFLTFGKFYLGEKKDILIFDARASDFLSIYFETNQFSFFYTRKEKFEIISFIFTLFKNGYKNFGRNYFFNYLKIYKPKFVLSMWVLNNNLFFVKKNFPKIKVIIIQSFRLTSYDLKMLSNCPSNSVDIFFTFRKFDEVKFKKIFNMSSFITIGSIKNNHYYKEENQKKSFLFFSEYKIGRLTYEEKTILKILNKYCKINKLKFDIQLRYKSIPKNYIKLIKQNKINNHDQFLTRDNFSSAYVNSNKYKILVLTNSTLCDEFISNFKKVVVLNSCMDFDDAKYDRVNHKSKKFQLENPMFKEMLPKNFSWSLTLNEKIVLKVIDKVVMCDELKWQKHINGYGSRFLYDHDNKIFLNKLNELGMETKLIR
jgi:surface carbohydrate biosynthesis protein